MNTPFKSVVKNILVVSLITLLFACGGKEERKAAYLEKGKAYLADKNYKKAKIEFKNVLQIDPKFAEAYYYMGEVHKNAGIWDKAYLNYKKTLELDPTHINAKIELGKIYVASNKIGKAEKLRDEVLNQNPASVGGKLLSSFILARKGKLETAISLLEETLKSSKDEETAVILASFYKENSQPELAIKLLNSNLKFFKESIDLRLELIKSYTQLNDFNKIEETLKELIRYSDKKFKFKVILSSFYAKKGRLDLAENILRGLIKEDESDAEKYVLLSQFLASRRSVEVAEEELLKSIQQKPKMVELSFALSKLYEQSKRLPKAINIYQEIIEKYGVEKYGLEARNYLVQIYLHENNFNAAKKLIDEVLTESPKDSNALFFKAKVALYNKNSTEAVNALRVLIGTQPDSTDAAALLADAYLMQKERELAESVLKKSMQSTRKNDKAYLNYAKFLNATTRYDEAGKYIDIALSINPKSIVGLKLKAEYLLRHKKIEQAINTIDKIKEINPNSIYGNQLLSQIYIKSKQYKKAILELDEALLKQPKNPTMIAAVVKLLVSQKKFQLAESRLKNNLSSNVGSDYILYELLGNVYWAQNKPAQAEQSFKSAIASNKSWDQPYLNLANIKVFQNKLAEAILILKNAESVVKPNTKILLRLATMYEKNNKISEAINVYEKLLPSGNVIALNNYASLVADHSGKSELAKVVELIARFENTNQPAFKDTYGWVMLKSGNFSKAIEVLKEVVALAPKVAIFQYHLGVAYYKNDDMMNAKKYLQQAVESKQKFSEKGKAKELLKSL